MTNNTQQTGSNPPTNNELKTTTYCPPPKNNGFYESTEEDQLNNYKIGPKVEIATNIYQDRNKNPFIKPAKGEDTALIANIVATEQDILKFVEESVEKNKKEAQGSTLTFGSLDNNGNLKFAILGDSPVYLAVKDKDNKDIVIQISSDMDNNSDRYRHLCLEIEPNNTEYLDKNNEQYKHCNSNKINKLSFDDKIRKLGLNRLCGTLEVFGAIGDSEIKGIIIKPELYDFSEGTIFYDKLNDFLKTIGIKTPITELLKTGGANVVMASDGLSDRKIENKSVCDYKICLNGKISKKAYGDAKDCLPAPTGIEFIAIEKDKVLDSQENPIFSTADNNIAKANKQINNLYSKDDVTAVPLQLGTSVLVLDGHGGQEVSHSAVQDAANFINRPLRLEMMEKKMQNEPRNRALKDAVELYQNKHIEPNSRIINSIIGCDNDKKITECERQYQLYDVKKIKEYLCYIIYGTKIEQTHTDHLLSGRKEQNQPHTIY
jgi:serine/threonine protein phosphatase PrpC